MNAGTQARTSIVCTGDGFRPTPAPSSTETYRNVELVTVRGERIEEIQVFFGGRTD